MKTTILTSLPNKSLVLSASLMALGSSIASAAITVTQTTTFPGTTAAETFETPLSSGALEIRDSRLATQTFQVDTAFTIDKIYVGVDTSGGFNPAQTYSLSIFTVADTNLGAPSAAPTGTNLLSTTTQTVSLGTAGTGGFLEFDLTGLDEITLAASTGTAGYALQIVNTSSTSAFRWRLNQSGDGTGGGTVGPDQYVDGQAYAGALGGGFTHGNSDFVLGFTAAPVPEPSSSLLVALGSATLLLRRRR